MCIEASFKIFSIKSALFLIFNISIENKEEEKDEWGCCIEQPAGHL